MIISYMAIPGIPRKESEMVLSKDKRVKIIIDVVCEHYSLTEMRIRTYEKTNATSDARHLVWYFMRMITGMGVVEIGNRFSRNHTTIVSASKKVRNLMFSDYFFKKEIHGLQKKIETQFANAKKQISENSLQLPE